MYIWSHVSVYQSCGSLLRPLFLEPYMKHPDYLGSEKIIPLSRIVSSLLPCLSLTGTEKLLQNLQHLGHACCLSYLAELEKGTEHYSQDTRSFSTEIC